VQNKCLDKRQPFCMDLLCNQLTGPVPSELLQFSSLGECAVATVLVNIPGLSGCCVTSSPISLSHLLNQLYFENNPLAHSGVFFSVLHLVSMLFIVM
jgi:hypothetical protein